MLRAVSCIPSLKERGFRVLFLNDNVGGGYLADVPSWVVGVDPSADHPQATAAVVADYSATAVRLEVVGVGGEGHSDSIRVVPFEPAVVAGHGARADPLWVVGSG